MPLGAEALDAAEKLTAICDLEFPTTDAVMDFPTFEGFINRQPGMRE